MDYRERGSYARGVNPTMDGYLAHENSEGEVRGGSRYKNNSKRVARHMKETWAGKGKSPKQGLTSAEDI